MPIYLHHRESVQNRGHISLYPLRESIDTHTISAKKLIKCILYFVVKNWSIVEQGELLVDSLIF